MIGHFSCQTQDPTSVDVAAWQSGRLESAWQKRTAVEYNAFDIYVGWPNNAEFMQSE